MKLVPTAFIEHDEKVRAENENKGTSELESDLIALKLKLKRLDKADWSRNSNGATYLRREIDVIKSILADRPPLPKIKRACRGDTVRNATTGKIGTVVGDSQFGRIIVRVENVTRQYLDKWERWNVNVLT